MSLVSFLCVKAHELHEPDQVKATFSSLIKNIDNSPHGSHSDCRIIMIETEMKTIVSVEIPLPESLNISQIFKGTQGEQNSIMSEYGLICSPCTGITGI